MPNYIENPEILVAPAPEFVSLHLYLRLISA